MDQYYRRWLIEANRLAPTVKLFSLADTTRAAGVTQKTIRNWLQRDQLVLSVHTPKHKRRLFTVKDVVQIALVRRLVEFGADVTVADRVSREIYAALPANITTSSGLGFTVAVSPSYEWAQLGAHDIAEQLQRQHSTLILRVQRIAETTLHALAPRILSECLSERLSEEQTATASRIADFCRFPMVDALGLEPRTR